MTTFSVVNAVRSISLPFDPQAHFKRCESIWERLKGWILYFFSYAICVYDESGNKYFYLRIKDLIIELCKSQNSPIPFQLATSHKLQRLVLETINPVINRKIFTKDVLFLFRAFRSQAVVSGLHLAKTRSGALHIATEQLHKLKNRHLTILPYEKRVLLRSLQPGDIFFRKNPHESKHVVVLGQWLMQACLFRKQKERESYKYSHAAIYLGNGKIAEAVPDPKGYDVRIVDLDDKEFALDPSSKIEYVVARPKNAALAKEAALIAASISDRLAKLKKSSKKPTRFRYSKTLAMLSLWHRSDFGLFARYRYLKQYIEDRQNELPQDFLTLKNFFCSYFVGYCLQTAESRRIMPAMLGKKDAPLQGITCLGTAVCRNLWARVRRFQFWKEMTSQVQYKFDAKRLTPQDLRNIVIKKTSALRDLYLIRPFSKLLIAQI